jgi:DNA-binding NarL/FixJ family response regulator
MTIKVLVADDHEVVRLGFRNMVRDTEIKMAAEASSGDEAVKMAKKHNLDVVLLDIRMPKGDGLTALGRIKLAHPDLPVLMFSMYDTPAYVARAVALGAAGFVHKGDTRKRIISAVRAAATGEPTWTREELRRISGALATPRLSDDVEVPLTKREAEVLRHLTNGLTNKEIGQKLKIGYETVKEHVQHILRKIGVSDRTQAALWSVRQGLAS